MRDSQRKRVYTAEHVLMNYAKPLPTVKDVERFIKKQMERKAILKRYPHANKETAVADGRGCKRALAHGTRKISIPIWARNDWVVIHEMAHIINARENWWPKAAHGWEYCSIYLDLVRFIMGVEAHDALKASFKKHKVKYKKPKSRKPLTPEQKAALAERLKAARLAKAA